MDKHFHALKVEEVVSETAEAVPRVADATFSCSSPHARSRQDGLRAHDVHALCAVDVSVVVGGQFDRHFYYSRPDHCALLLRGLSDAQVAVTVPITLNGVPTSLISSRVDTST